MLKRTVEYVDYDGNPRKEDFYFNLSKAEVIDWLTTSGNYTLDKVLDRLAQEQNVKEILEIFKDVLYRAYGKKSLDGRRFMKDEETKREFVETEAYSILYTELATDAKKAADFINAIIPADLAADVEKIIRENPDGIPDTLKDYIPDGVLPGSAPSNVTPITQPTA